jgi:glycosyltransferase involved in cell wall biosynthesis
MTDKKPLVSIGMPVYNGEIYVSKAIRSLLLQDYSNFELIISDNASVDDTAIICRNYAAKDSRIIFHQNIYNMGAYENFKLVLRMSKGEFFMFAACDDFWEPTFISSLVSSLLANSSSPVAMCAVKIVTEDGIHYDTIRFFNGIDPSKIDNFRLSLNAAINPFLTYYIYGLYKKIFIEQAYLNLPSVFGSDVLFVCQVFLSAKPLYTDKVLHIKMIRNRCTADLYSEELIGKLYGKNLKYTTMSLALGPFLFRSTVISWRRKLWIPIISARQMIWCLKVDSLDFMTNLCGSVWCYLRMIIARL